MDEFRYDVGNTVLVRVIYLQESLMTPVDQCPDYLLFALHLLDIRNAILIKKSLIYTFFTGYIGANM
jgi:hypothetical protein